MPCLTEEDLDCIDYINDLDQIDEIERSGHHRHCACRQIWGDGECECEMYAKGYDPYWWMN